MLRILVACVAALIGAVFVDAERAPATVSAHMDRANYKKPPPFYRAAAWKAANRACVREARNLQQALPQSYCASVWVGKFNPSANGKVWRFAGNFTVATRTGDGKNCRGMGAEVIVPGQKRPSATFRIDACSWGSG
jgi:hypothetical protein